jgi:hypothetical protein
MHGVAGASDREAAFAATTAHKKKRRHKPRTFNIIWVYVFNVAYRYFYCTPTFFGRGLSGATRL